MQGAGNICPESWNRAKIKARRVFGHYGKHPCQTQFCKGDSKRCVKHWIKFSLLRLSDADRQIPTAAELLKLHARDGFTPRPPRPMKSGQIKLPVKGRHCYRLTVALEKDAKVPEGTNLLSARNLRSADARFGISDIFHRVADVGDIGCAPRSTLHDLKPTAHKGQYASNRTEAEPSMYQGVVFGLQERRMKPSEVAPYFCRQCDQVAGRCRRRLGCANLRKCLQRRSLTPSACRDLLDLH